MLVLYVQVVVAVLHQLEGVRIGGLPESGRTIRRLWFVEVWEKGFVVALDGGEVRFEQLVYKLNIEHKLRIMNLELRSINFTKNKNDAKKFK